MRIFPSNKSDPVSDRKDLHADPDPQQCFFDKKKVGHFLLQNPHLESLWNSYNKQCSGSVTFWYGSGSADPYLSPTDPDLALFVNDLQDTNKK
jgi:hypothetical protein